jgi:sec-independent protein translocase protein TatA
MYPLFAFNLSPEVIIIVLLLGVLFFGRRLPEVGRSLGKGIVEFKKGMRGLEDDIEGPHPAAPPAYRPEQPQQPVEQIRPPQRVPTTAPKFEDSPNVIQPPPKP